MSAALRAAIGNPDDYHHTGRVEQADELAYCPCGVAIIHLYEIINEYTNQRFMIGSVCAKRVGIYVGKLCDTCNEPNKMKTKHCHRCRKKCPLHKKYHDDNIVHASKRMNFSAGIHRGKSPDDLLGEFDGYLIWIADKPDWSNTTQREYIIENLLSNCVNPRFKKYPGKSLGWLKANQPEYFDYMRCNDKGCYLNLVK